MFHRTLSRLHSGFGLAIDIAPFLPCIDVCCERRLATPSFVGSLSSLSWPAMQRSKYTGCNTKRVTSSVWPLNSYLILKLTH